MSALITAVQTLNAKKDILTQRQAELNAAIIANDAGVKVEINEIDLEYDNNGLATKKNLSIKKYFAKVKPVITLVSNNNDELVVEISNPSDSAKALTVIGYSIKNANGVSMAASLDEQNITIAA